MQDFHLISIFMNPFWRLTVYMAVHRTQQSKKKKALF